MTESGPAFPLKARRPSQFYDMNLCCGPVMAEMSEKHSLDDKLVTRICQILNFASVPNLLWGNYLLTVYGVPTITEVGILFSSDDTIAESMAWVAVPTMRHKFVYSLIKSRT